MFVLFVAVCDLELHIYVLVFWFSFSSLAVHMQDMYYQLGEFFFFCFFFFLDVGRREVKNSFLRWSGWWSLTSVRA